MTSACLVRLGVCLAPCSIIRGHGSAQLRTPPATRGRRSGARRQPRPGWGRRAPPARPTAGASRAPSRSPQLPGSRRASLRTRHRGQVIGGGGTHCWHGACPTGAALLKFGVASPLRTAFLPPHPDTPVRGPTVLRALPVSYVALLLECDISGGRLSDDA